MAPSPFDSKYPVYGSYSFFMPPTLEKLKGHIALGSCVRPSVRPSVHASVQNLLRYSFEISYMDTSSKK